MCVATSLDGAPEYLICEQYDCFFLGFLDLIVLFRNGLCLESGMPLVFLIWIQRLRPADVPPLLLHLRQIEATRLPLQLLLHQVLPSLCLLSRSQSMRR